MCGKSCICLLLISLFYQVAQPSFNVHWQKFITTTTTQEACAPNNMKLLSLLNLLCNTTQIVSIQMRDACYGCFFRAGNLINGVQQLSSLNDCAKLYITETAYGQCANDLDATIASNNRPIVTNPVTIGAGIKIGIAGALNYCYTGYCDFVRCIRRINAETLISSCYNETLGVRTLVENAERVSFYLNITNCILAKTRCSQYNPITGELQTLSVLQQQNALPLTVPAGAAIASVTAGGGAAAPAITLSAAAGNLRLTENVLAPISFNALHINEAGDLRVLNFPVGSAKLNDNFCVRATTMQQSAYGAYTC